MADNAVSFWKYYQGEYPLNVMVVGQTECDPGYHVERECSHIMALEYITDGAGVLQINGKTYHPCKNGVVVLTKNSCHSYKTDPDFGWKKRWVVFDGPLMEHLLSVYLPKNEYYFSNCNLTHYFDQIDRLITLYRDDYGKMTDKMAVTLLEMLLQIKNSASRTQYDLAERIRQALDMQIEQRLSLDELAAGFNYSKNHIIRIFREKYGVTPYQYFIDRKVDIAKLYLCNTNYAVTEIAEQLSFTDEHYFSNYFRSAVGMSPSRYRKQVQQNTGSETPSLIK